MIYNSTIGLEATILGKPVLCAGRARFTQLPTVFFPQTVRSFQAMLESFLHAEAIDIPGEYQFNARRFLYYQLFLSSLPFESFLDEDGHWPGFVRLRRFNCQELHPDHSIALRIIHEGILNGVDFILPAEVEYPAS
jgi:hypothetical protein